MKWTNRFNLMKLSLAVRISSRLSCLLCVFFLCFFCGYLFLGGKGDRVVAGAGWSDDDAYRVALIGLSLGGFLCHRRLLNRSAGRRREPQTETTIDFGSVCISLLYVYIYTFICLWSKKTPPLICIHLHTGNIDHCLNLLSQSLILIFFFFFFFFEFWLI